MLRAHSARASAYRSPITITGGSFNRRWTRSKHFIAETDPALVSFLLDAGHAYRGGADVPAFLRRHHDRIVALHLRDYSNGKQVPLGQGTFPLAQVAADLEASKMEGLGPQRGGARRRLKAGT